MSKNIRIFPFHEFSVILREFKRCPFEIHATRGAGKHKTKVNVDNVTININ